jgi:hypothetical protein
VEIKKMAGLALFSWAFVYGIIDSFKKGVRYETGATNPQQKPLDYL